MGTINDLLRKFKAFSEELENLSGKTITVLPDANGMIDKRCPKEGCKSYFKVNSDDWKNIVKDEVVYCPFCKNNSKAEDYMPPEQRTAIVQGIRRSVMENWHHGTPINQNIFSLPSKEEFELHIQCEKCSVRYSVLGTAYFCPCCGFNSVERNAKSSIEKLMLKAERIESIQKAFEQTFTKDEAAIITKNLIENSLSDCVGALQTFSEEKYNHLSPVKAPFNAFQNVEKANKLWVALKGEGYETWLTQTEQQQLLLYTQRRHLLEHKGGIVDGKYLEITGDSSYSIGNRVIVNPSDVTALGKIVLKIIDSINKP